MAIFDGRTHPATARSDRPARVRDHGAGWNVLSGCQDRQESLVGGKRDAVCRGQQDPRLCRRPHRPPAGAQRRQRHRLDTIATENVLTKLANSDTDRIYLVSDGGLIQCLREVEQTEPIVHGRERKEAAKAEGQSPAPKEQEKPAKKEYVARAAGNPQTAGGHSEKGRRQGRQEGQGPAGAGKPATPPKGKKPPPQDNNNNPF